jgi:hypothetical protein
VLLLGKEETEKVPKKSKKSKKVVIAVIAIPFAAPSPVPKENKSSRLPKGC